MNTERCNDEQEEQQKLESEENFKEKINKLKNKNTHEAKRLLQPAIALMSTKFWTVINSFSMCFF